MLGGFNLEKKKKLEEGVNINGIKYRPLKITRILGKNNEYELDVELQEGKNREIRKLMKHFELKVKQLKRTEYGSFKLNNLIKDNIREVSSLELKEIFKKMKYKDESNFW